MINQRDIENNANAPAPQPESHGFSLRPLSRLVGSMREKVTAALNFYASFHQNPVNQKIHTVCIPLLVWTAMVWLSAVPFPITGNVANLLAIGYCLGYGLYDYKMGLTSSGILGLFSYTANLFSKAVPHANLAALVLHGAAWGAQIWGHSRFEGNRPALLDSLLQSVYIAPLFSLIEACDFLGIKKSPLVTQSVFNRGNRNRYRPSLAPIPEELEEKESREDAPQNRVYF
jgi:2-hydroxy fatty acid dioxygenase